MITIVDYGMGNIKAFQNVYQKLNILCKVAKNADNLKDARKIILPGVGSFDQVMHQLNNSGMREELEKQVISNKVPVVGICVGMQILAKSSEEGVEQGLGWIDGRVKKFDESTIKHETKLPHMGWNSIEPVNGSKFLADFNKDTRFYFLHSYYFAADNPLNIIAETDYGIRYASAINKENIYGIQFHPEKSHSNGVQLLKNFSEL